MVTVALDGKCLWCRNESTINLTAIVTIGCCGRHVKT
jgi:hypothetical protein